MENSRRKTRLFRTRVCGPSSHGSVRHHAASPWGRLEIWQRKGSASPKVWLPYWGGKKWKTIWILNVNKIEASGPELENRRAPPTLMEDFIASLVLAIMPERAGPGEPLLHSCSPYYSRNQRWIQRSQRRRLLPPSCEKNIHMSVPRRPRWATLFHSPPFSVCAVLFLI